MAGKYQARIEDLDNALVLGAFKTYGLCNNATRA